MEILQLKKEDEDEIIDLFADCFQFDHYYAELFDCTTGEVLKKNIRREFDVDIRFCIEQEMSYGIKNERGKFFAFLLCFDFHDVEKKHPNNFKRMFGETVKSWKFLKEHDKICYFLAVGVEKKSQRKGYASKLVDFVMEKFKNYAFASDVSNSSSLSIYKKRNFEIEEKEAGYFFVSKNGQQILK